MPIPRGWTSLRERHPVRINGLNLIIEHLTCTPETWAADDELRAIFPAVGLSFGYIRGVRVIRGDGSCGLHLYDPGAN
jgi:hypothetical protein